jgi:hypothetical protein
MSSRQVRALVAPVLTALGTAASTLTAGIPHSTHARIMTGVASIVLGAAVWVTQKKAFEQYSRRLCNTALRQVCSRTQCSEALRLRIGYPRAFGLLI